MSSTGKYGLGIPTVLMHEGEGLIVTVETKAGIAYRGVMEMTEDKMNTSLTDVTAIDARGRTTKMERVYIRGSQIVLVIFPDMLGQAPMFKRAAAEAAGKVVAGGLGRGRQKAIEAKGEPAD
jgi:small nuclear ribonucleoprotein D3